MKSTTPTRSKTLHGKKGKLGRTKLKLLRAKQLKKEQRKQADADASKSSVPQSLIFRRGKAPRVVKELVHDLRAVMSPNTARALKERNKNTVEDYRAVAAELGVTHLMALSVGDAGGTLLRIGRVPKGPSLSLKVERFTTAKEVQCANGSYRGTEGAEFQESPLVVINNFDQEQPQLKLACVTFQNMFPSINVEEVNIRHCRRVVLFQYDKERNVIEFRHYLITATPTGINRNFKKLIGAKKPVSLGDVKDIGDVLDRQVSESEMSEEETKVVLAQGYWGKLNQAATSNTEQSRVKLVELGPRIEFTLLRVFEGIFDGTVLYTLHGDAAKETAAMEKMMQKQKAKRRLDKKRREAEAEQKAKEEKQERRKRAMEDDKASAAVDDDKDWFRKEVGEEDPDAADDHKARRGGGGQGLGVVDGSKRSAEDERTTKRKAVLKKLLTRKRPAKKGSADEPQSKRQRS
eukprot:m51a1_g5527 hypothetical protein (462) ;mRNA; f:432802-434560